MFLKRITDRYVATLGITAFALAIALSLALPGRFADADNLASMAVQMAELGMFSVAMALALLIGGIDLSIVAVANLASLCAALCMRQLAAGDAAAVYGVMDGTMGSTVLVMAGLLVALAVGALAGLFNGLLIHSWGVPSILATLGTMTLVMGVAMGITNGSSVSGLPEVLGDLGNSTVATVPVAFVVFALVWLLAQVVCRNSAFGTNMRLLGTSQKVAEFSGIPTGKIVVRTYMATAMIAATAGFMNLLRTSSASPDYGQTYVLLALLVVVLGGISVTGGAGKMLGVLWALVILQLLSTGFNMLLLNVSDGNFFRDFVWGLLLLSTMAITAVLNKRPRKNPLFRK